MNARSWTRRGAAALACLMVAGCSSDGEYEENTYPVSRGHDRHAEVIGTGRLGVDRWDLLAQQDGDGQLCLGVRWTPSDPPPDVGCGFGSNTVDSEGRGTEPAATTQSTDGQGLAFGPSPDRAVRAVLTLPTIEGTDCVAGRMSPTIVAIDHRVPDWYPREGTGWFAVQVPTAAVTCPLNVTFFDSSDHEVGQPNNF